MASINSNEQTIPPLFQGMLRDLSPNLLAELRCFSKPPLACELILEGVGILLHPEKQNFQWADAKELMKDSTVPFIQRLRTFDQNRITADQLVRLRSILSHEECQPERVARVSLACQQINLWLRAIVDDAESRQANV